MENSDNDISINFLDHVAIRVKDMEASADWYGRVLGLKKYQVPKWGAFPIFLLAGKSGVALFPANLKEEVLSDSKNVGFDHFAFNVSNEDFVKAQKRYADLGLTFQVKDHHYFHSIYTKDPDGFTVELTTLMVKEEDFYG